MLPASFETDRLSLSPIAPEHAPAIFGTYAQDPEVTRYLTWRPHRSLDDTAAYIGACVATPAERARTYVIVDRSEGDLRGALHVRRTAAHRLEFGYLLARPFWGRGLMTEVLGAAASWALARPDDVFRVGAVCDVDNMASGRVLEKAGLSLEGVLRRWLVHPNLSEDPRDCFSYSRVR